MSSDQFFRVQKTSNYSVLDNQFLERDARLSYKAKGILAYLLSRPDSWKIVLSDIINRAADGRDAVLSGIKELESAGYIVRERLRNGGRMAGTVYVVHERPCVSMQISPQTENPFLENSADFGDSKRKRRNQRNSPQTDFPYTDNPTLVNTDCSKDSDGIEEKGLKSTSILCSNNRAESNLFGDDGPASRPRFDFVSAAESIYDEYPRKMAKRHAIKAIIAAIRRESKRLGSPTSAHTHLLLRVRDYSRQWERRDKTYCPYPATWFNGERYNDSAEKVQKQQSESKRSAVEYDYDEWSRGTGPGTPCDEAT